MLYMCDWKCNTWAYLVANLPLSLTVKEFLSSVNNFIKVMNKYRVARFMVHGVHCNCVCIHTVFYDVTFLMIFEL